MSSAVVIEKVQNGYIVLIPVSAGSPFVGPPVKRQFVFIDLTDAVVFVANWFNNPVSAAQRAGEC